MKKLLFSLTLCLFALPLHAQNVWSSKIDTFGNFAPAPGSNANGIVSIFTPATGITVNRIQLQVAGGQKCSTLPGIRVTDGATSAFLAIPNTTAASAPGPASNDSGEISLSFPAGDTVRVKAVAAPKGCNPYEINIVVQYSVTP